MAQRNGRRRYSRDVEHRLGVPGLNLIRSSVNGQDVIVGAAVGLAAAGGIKYALNTYAASVMNSLPAFVVRLMPTLTGVAAGAALYAAQKRSNGARARAHLVGAVAAGVSVNVWQELSARFPQLQDYVSVRMGAYGALVDDPYRRLGGVIVDDSARNLAELTSVNMEQDEEAAAAL